MAYPSTGDTIAILRPYDRFRGRPSDKHAAKTFGPTKSKDIPYDNHRDFSVTALIYTDIRTMDAALAAVAADGHGIIVRSQPLEYTGPCVRRIMRPQGDDQAGLQAADLHLACVDADVWPNLEGLDPRTDPEKAWRWMLSILGPEFAKATVSCWWSSSCCVRTEYEPVTLSAKLFFYLDSALGEIGIVQLLKRANRRVEDFFASARNAIRRALGEPVSGPCLKQTDRRAQAFLEGVRDDPDAMAEFWDMKWVFKKGHKLVDHRVGLVSQLIYIAPPKFLPGASDPLAGCVRQKLLVGKRATLSVADLLKNLPTLEHARVAKVRQKASPKPTTAARLPKARTLSVHIPGMVIPLAAAGREIEAMRAACRAAIDGDDERYRDECSQFFHRRVAQEQLALVADRGGLFEGDRNNGSLLIASAITASLPLTMSVAQVRHQVRAMLSLIVDEAWISDEWEGKGDSSVIQRFQAAQRGEKGLNNWDPRYTYFKARLLEEWDPTLDEVRRLGFRSLLSELHRSQMRRDANAGVTTPAQIERQAKILEVRRLHDAGRSLREIETATGIPASTANGYLKASVAADVVSPDVADVVAAAPAAAPVVPADTENTAAVKMLLVRGEDYADVMAAQLGLTTDQVRRALNRLGHDELIRPTDALALAA